MIIEGNLLELNTKNGNGWGIGDSEVENLLKTLPGVPLKICSGKEALTNEHSCDYIWNPNAQIGKIVSAEKIGNWIHTKAEVTDPEVRRNIQIGNLSKKWSIFAGYSDKINDMLQGTKALSVTLVKNPAYPNAGYNVAASVENMQRKQPVAETTGMTDLDRYYLESWKGTTTPIQKENPAEALRKSLERLGSKGKNPAKSINIYSK